MMSKNSRQQLGTREIALIGLMAALVFVGSKIEIRFPTPLGGVTRFHLGNGMCLLAGFTIGALPGGLAAGFGSFFFDVVFWGGNPVGWLVTFATKFLMGFVGGLCFEKRWFSALPLTANLVLCGVFGEIAYIAGYLLKEFITYYFVMGYQWQAMAVMMVQKGISSVVNAVIAVILSLILYRVLEPILKKNGLL